MTTMLIQGRWNLWPETLNNSIKTLGKLSDLHSSPPSNASRCPQSYHSPQVVPADAIPDGWMGLDIGPDSIKTFGETLDTAKTVIWNGPMGVFEFEKFAVGTDVSGGYSPMRYLCLLFGFLWPSLLRKFVFECPNSTRCIDWLAFFAFDCSWVDWLTVLIVHFTCCRCNVTGSSMGCFGGCCTVVHNIPCTVIPSSHQALALVSMEHEGRH